MELLALHLLPPSHGIFGESGWESVEKLAEFNLLTRVISPASSNHSFFFLYSFFCIRKSQISLDFFVVIFELNSLCENPTDFLWQRSRRIFFYKKKHIYKKCEPANNFSLCQVIYEACETIFSRARILLKHCPITREQPKIVIRIVSYFLKNFLARGNFSSRNVLTLNSAPLTKKNILTKLRKKNFIQWDHPLKYKNQWWLGAPQKLYIYVYFSTLK